MAGQATRDVSEAVDLAQRVPTDWLCNTDAVAAGRLDRARPSRSTLEAFADRADDALIVERPGGLAVFTAADGHADWRHLVVEPIDNPELLVELATPACERWGRVKGRVTNPKLREVMLQHPDCRLDVDDEQVLWFEPLGARG